MSESKIITNTELQESLTKHIRSLDSGEAEPQHAKIYFAGARTLLGSVKMDMESAKSLGVPLYKRTRDFLGQK